MKMLFYSCLGISLLGALSCSQSTPKAYLTPFLPIEKVQDSVQSYDPKVDILFVVDDSGSMMGHQTRLAGNIDKFTSVFLQGSVLDYNIGVVTTSSETTPYSSGDCCGRLVGATRIVNKSVSNADSVLGKNIMVGTGGDSTERPFDAAYLALTEPNLSTWNKGFIRPDSTVVVIFITDARDQSNKNENDLYDMMLNLRGGDKSRILAYGAIVPSNDTLDCPRDEYTNGEPVNIEAFLNKFLNRKNNVMNLCDPDFGLRLANLAKDIVENSGRLILLNRIPDQKTISVTYGTLELPEDADKGWLFDPARNAIALGNHIDWASQPAGSKIKVYYNAVDSSDK